MIGQVSPSVKKERILSILGQEATSVQNNTFCFREGNCLPRATAGAGIVASVKNALKRHSGLYYFIVTVIAPVKPTRELCRLQKNLLERYSKNSDVVVNYGSGPRILCGRHDIINVDLFAFDEVDVASDTLLPFKPETVDLFLSSAVLEHMPNPRMAVSEMFRCLKPQGELLVFVPFAQPIHAAPDDYNRWTMAGLRELFGAFTVVDIGLGAGPTSGLLWFFQEWLSLSLSFGNRALKDMVLIGLMLVTFPLKYLDVLLETYPTADTTASGFYIHARK